MSRIEQNERLRRAVEDILYRSPAKITEVSLNRGQIIRRLKLAIAEEDGACETISTGEPN